MIFYRKIAYIFQAFKLAKFLGESSCSDRVLSISSFESLFSVDYEFNFFSSKHEVTKKEKNQDLKIMTREVPLKRRNLIRFIKS